MSARVLVLLAASLVFVASFVAISVAYAGHEVGGEPMGKEATARGQTGVEHTSVTPDVSEGGAIPQSARPDRCLVRLPEFRPKGCDEVPQALQDHMR